MHVACILYPRAEANSDFNMEHYLAVHLKLGFGLMKKLFGVAPVRALVQYATRGLDGKPASAPYLVICQVVFESRAHLDLFLDVFRNEAAARALAADWPNYCPQSPEIVIGEFLELPGVQILEGADQVIAGVKL